MSHASIIVALPPEQTKGKSIEDAVGFQMAPFDENGKIFKSGSRWDWWSIGGRYTGKFAIDYDACDDPANQQTCWLCQGTGKRNDQLGVETRQRNPAYTCNGCEGTGMMLKHASDFKDVGNICLRSSLTEELLHEGQVKAAHRLWAKWQAEPRKDDAFTMDYVYGLKPGDTLESVVERYSKIYLTAYAFLKDRCWYEGERLGWFGGSAKTECEIKADKKGEDYKGRCLHTCKKSGAKIVSLNEPFEGRWDQLYWARFIRPLPLDTTLVVVDYHV